jgi:hypothetical protein
MCVYKNGAISVGRIRSVGRSKYAIAVIMRMLVLIVVLAVLLLAMDAVAAESRTRRMLGNRGGGSAPGSPLPNPNQFHHG